MIHPDVEVYFVFNDVRKHPAHNGYRPAHLITNNCLTTGVHHYYDVEELAPNSSAKGTITFITPEVYPHCLWIGKTISIQEGEKIIGFATIIKIFNPILERKSHSTGDGTMCD